MIEIGPYFALTVCSMSLIAGGCCALSVWHESKERNSRDEDQARQMQALSHAYEKYMQALVAVSASEKKEDSSG